MTLPTFVGIGLPRSGSTWLHEFLATHSHVYVPTRRKEVRFFDQYYERGLGWYESFFPPDTEVERFQAIGEVSPTYFYCPECPQRMAQVPEIKQLLLILRNPIDRAFSAYKIYAQLNNFAGSFEDFLAQEPDAIPSGFYSQWLQNYLQVFDRNQILVLIFEHMVTDVRSTQQALASFLGVAPDEFNPPREKGKVNPSHVPAQGLPRILFTLSGIAYRKLRDWDVDWIVQKAKPAFKRFFSKGVQLPPIKPETRERLTQIYRNEIRDLENLVEIDLSVWTDWA